MKAIKCDMCKQFYALENRRYNKIVILRCTYDGSSAPTLSFDVCPDCALKIAYEFGVTNKKDLETPL